MRHGSPALLCLLGALGLACEEETAVAYGEAATLVVVDPIRFMGNVPCSDVPGGAQLYVATVVDITLAGLGDAGPTGGEEFALPSSPPIPCTDAVSFANVVAGHYYVADIEAYDRGNLEPRGPGSPLMVDRESGEHVQPRWASSCGRATREDPLLALPETIRTLRRCDLLVDRHPDGVTGIGISLAPLQGNRECGSEAGQISGYRATLDGADGQSLEAECDAPASFTGLEPNRNYRLTVEAFEEGQAEPRWVTGCFAKTVLGVTIPASCDPLHDTDDGGAGGSGGAGGDGSGGAAGAAGEGAL